MKKNLAGGTLSWYSVIDQKDETAEAASRAKRLLRRSRLKRYDPARGRCGILSTPFYAAEQPD